MTLPRFAALHWLSFLVATALQPYQPNTLITLSIVAALLACSQLPQLPWQSVKKSTPVFAKTLAFYRSDIPDFATYFSRTGHHSRMTYIRQ